VEIYLHSSSTPSWCGAQLKHRDNFTFHLLLFQEPRYKIQRNAGAQTWSFMSNDDLNERLARQTYSRYSEGKEITRHITSDFLLLVEIIERTPWRKIFLG
jgi:hypothetical protein